MHLATGFRQVMSKWVWFSGDGVWFSGDGLVPSWLELWPGLSASLRKLPMLRREEVELFVAAGLTSDL